MDLPAAIILVGFTCLISFYTYAKRAAVYIFGERSKLPVKIVWVLLLSSQVVKLRKNVLGKGFPPEKKERMLTFGGHL